MSRLLKAHNYSPGFLRTITQRNNYSRTIYIQPALLYQQHEYYTTCIGRCIIVPLSVFTFPLDSSSQCTKDQSLCWQLLIFMLRLCGILSRFTICKDCNWHNMQSNETISTQRFEMKVKLKEYMQGNCINSSLNHTLNLNVLSS